MYNSGQKYNTIFVWRIFPPLHDSNIFNYLL